MIKSVQLPDIAHTLNPIRLKVETTAFAVVNYVLEVDGNVLFRGSGIADANGKLTFNLAGILHNTVKSIYRNNYDILIEYPELCQEYYVKVSDQENELKAKGIAVFGGIGNDTLRRLMLKDSTIFKQRLFDNNQNRLLTGRTENKQLVVRENELAPLLFLANEKDTAISIHTHDNKSLRQLIPGSGIRALGINLEYCRRLFYDYYKKLYAKFDIHCDAQNTCTVYIVPSLAPKLGRNIRYRNSLGAYERLELSGLLEYRPLFSEDEEYRVYDPLQDDYTLLRDRRKVIRVYKGKAGFKSQDDLYALQDLLQSDDTWLLSGGTEYACLVSASEPILAKDENTPLEVELEIKLKDESIGVEYDPEELFSSYEGEWFNPVCQLTQSDCSGEWREFIEKKEPEEPDDSMVLHFLFNTKTRISFDELFAGTHPEQEILVNFGDGDSYLGRYDQAPVKLYESGIQKLRIKAEKLHLKIQENEYLTQIDFHPSINLELISVNYCSILHTLTGEAYSLSKELNPDNDLNPANETASIFAYNPQLTNIELFNFICPNTEDFSDCFGSCPNLSSTGTPFIKSPKARNFMGCYIGGANLTSTGTPFVGNYFAIDFSSCFAYCGSLTETGTPFNDSSLEADFFMCYANCDNLNKIDTDLFKECQPTSLGSCFFNCIGIRERVPEYWVLYPDIWGKNCFKGVENALNYDSIHPDWK